MIHVTGEWDESSQRIVMESSARRSDGRARLRWTYRADPQRDDAWIKEMFKPDGDAGWKLASSYRYVPR